ncbi:MAG TPA: hypothetical protein ENN08_05115 [Bacteroidales bacterium]|nr:hypothetical protein [Bacteroidales bacterium]
MPGKKHRENRSIYIYTEKFTEGEWHPFKILKMIEIPDDECYFMMESRQGNRMLMPAKYYANYGIEPKSTVLCRIDKINCSGRIFLEPAHPYYATGELYDFKLTKKRQMIDRKNRKVERYFMMGHRNKIFEAITEDLNHLLIPCRIQARITGIRKGVLILRDIKLINNC